MKLCIILFFFPSQESFSKGIVQNIVLSKFYYAEPAW